MRVTREINTGLDYRIPFGAAIFNIAGWTTKGYVQKAARRSEHELQTRDEDRDIEAPDPTAVQQLDQVGQDEDVTRLFADLPDRERELMTLVYLDGLKLAEAAEVMGVTGNNAHQIHHRAKQKLMQVIAGDVA